jgi:hypothetical protein
MIILINTIEIDNPKISLTVLLDCDINIFEVANNAILKKRISIQMLLKKFNGRNTRNGTIKQ